MKRLYTLVCLLAVFQSYATVNFPFPHTAAYAATDLVVSNTKVASFGTTTNAIYTSANKANALRGRFLEWKANQFAQSGNYARIKWDDPSYSTSQSIGYGMLFMVYFSDAITSYESEFQGLWKYYQANSNAHGLMNRKVEGFNFNCATGGCGSSTEGDLLVALALVIGHYQFNNAHYKTNALSLLDSIFKYDVETELTRPGYAGLLRPGDNWNSYYNPSYFSVAAIHVFQEFDSNNSARWGTVLSRNHELYKANLGTYKTGLITDWCNENGTPISGESAPMFLTDATHGPLWMGVAASWFDDSDALSNSEMMGNWISGKVGTNASQIYGKYYQNGTPSQNFTESQYLGSFASALVAAKTSQTLIDNIWVKMMENTDYTYFNATMRLISGLYISGYMPNLLPQVPMSSSSVSSSEILSSTNPSSSLEMSSSSITLSSANPSSSMEMSSSSITLSSSVEPTTMVRNVPLQIPQISLGSGNTIRVSLVESSPVRIQVYGLMGKLETKVFQGALVAGTYEYPLKNLKRGVYLIQVQSNAGAQSKRITIRN